ncbi:hypothetical protein [Streptomyces sp. NPDC094032]|uniref:hypothetical protein n=1 Tax=Streptomyces sp. NPDC094032 TaxID=3155308 RepID=UPI0033298ECB
MRSVKALGLAAVLLAAAAAPASAGSLITVIDNSEADSILEVDRAANFQLGGQGTVGSDHDGSAVDAIQALMGAVGGDED